MRRLKKLRDRIDPACCWSIFRGCRLAAGAFARARLIIARAKKAMVAATLWGFMARGAPGRV